MNRSRRASAGPRPPKAGDERIVRSTVKGYLRIYTPETPIYDDEGLIGWNNDNYRIVPESGTRAQTWFDRRPLALNPEIYVVETLNLASMPLSPILTAHTMREFALRSSRDKLPRCG
jgi:hypothetical protein